MLAIGRALMARPRLLLLDEPSMGLAPMLVAQIFSIITEINQQGTTILLVEQNAAQALRPRPPRLRARDRPHRAQPTTPRCCSTTTRCRPPTSAATSRADARARDDSHRAQWPRSWWRLACWVPLPAATTGSSASPTTSEATSPTIPDRGNVDGVLRIGYLLPDSGSPRPSDPR